MQGDDANMQKDLVSRLVKGDDEAFSELYSLYYNRLIYFTMKFVKSEDVAKDIYQDVFTAVWQTRHFINIDSSFSSYLYTITRNRILNLLRDTDLKRRVHDHIMSQAIDYNQQDDETIVIGEYKELLMQAINKLTKRQRQVFELSRFENLSHKEIAQKLEISVYTVQEHVSAALKIIQEHIRKYGSNPGIIALLLLLVNKS